MLLKLQVFLLFEVSFPHVFLAGIFNNRTRFPIEAFENDKCDLEGYTEKHV